MGIDFDSSSLSLSCILQCRSHPQVIIGTSKILRMVLESQTLAWNMEMRKCSNAMQQEYSESNIRRKAGLVSIA